MSKTIRIDDDIWEVLKSVAVPLEDTPSTALRRIIVKAGLLSAADVFDKELDNMATQERIEALNRSVAELVSGHARRGLEQAGIKTIGDLVQKNEEELLKLKWFGRKSLNEVKETLAKMSLTLGVKLTKDEAAELLLIR